VRATNHPDGTTHVSRRAPDRGGVAATRLLVIVFEDAVHAEGALAMLSDLADDHVLTLKDAAVVTRGRADDGGPGAVEVHQARALATGEGVVGGGTIGLLVGLAAGLPIAAALAGMAGGAGIAAIDTGIDDDELRRLGGELAGGGAAVAALAASDDWERAGAALAALGGALTVSDPR
jgi:uncharacterized membrane protein